MNEAELPTNFVVWAVSPEDKFLNGKFVWAHWDIDGLDELLKEIKVQTNLRSGFLDGRERCKESKLACEGKLWEQRLKENAINFYNKRCDELTCNIVMVA